jgi:hypothetical protein
MVLIPTVINATSPYYHSIRGASEGLVEGGAGADYYNNNGIYFFMEVTNINTDTHEIISNATQLQWLHEFSRDQNRLNKNICCVQIFVVVVG